MPLAEGTKLGPYEILASIGAGGMGEVYKATDTKLGRQVALKLLRPEMVEDPASVARFEREARTLASLNHSCIAAIYGFEEQAGLRFLALEYVPGPTLADRLRRGAIPIHESILISRQIAEALEATHAKGIIHRDLKPANIKVSENGKVKVLDFGLAKPMQRPQLLASTDSTAALTEKLTERMTIVGTASYMSPEQASGKELDAQTDIWSFGCVLYEMLTGKQSFAGESVTEILAAVLEREPDWAALPTAAPAPLQLMLKRCLRKDPHSRLRDIGDVRIELEDVLAAPAQEVPTSKPLAMTRRTAISALSGAAAGAAATGIFAISRYRGVIPRRLTQFGIAAPDTGIFLPSFNKRIAISPNGARIAFNALVAGSDAFYLRLLAELESKLVKDAVRGGSAFFSPDGRWVGLFTGLAAGAVGANPMIQKLALSGGSPINICQWEAFSGGTWADDNSIYFVATNPGGVMSVSAAGGQPKEIAKIDFGKGERQHKYPCALPEGKAVLATVATSDIATFDEARIVAFSPSTGQRKVLVEGGTHPRYSPSGHLLYARDGKILAVRFDPQRLEVQGQPFTVLEGVQMSRNTGVANFDVSATGD
jgi:serine/threonine-protein kinase